MNRILVLSLSALLCLGLAAGCEFDREKKSQGDREEEARAAAAELKADKEAQIAGAALAAAQRFHFQPSPEQTAILNAGPAVNPSGAPNGYFTNPEGVSGYFSGYFQNNDRPFNFLWTGGTAERRVLDGRTLRLVDGPGELILKYEGDELILQRFKGEFKDGLWNGHGEHWIRNRDTGGHHYLAYTGEFRHDRMNGRGVLINYNFGGSGAHPFQYDGEMFNDNFHGRGVATDLATGRMIYKGLWFDDQPFAGDLEQWRAAEARAELAEPTRQYSDVLTTDELEIIGFINAKPGQGPLTVVPPEGSENAQVSDQSGRTHQAVAMVHPFKKGSRQPAEIQVDGFSLDLPLSDYPQTLTLSYDRDGKKHWFRWTAVRPFGLELKPVPASPKTEAAQPETAPAEGEAPAAPEPAKQEEAQ